MTVYNLSLPVVDAQRRMPGVLVMDAGLEAPVSQVRHCRVTSTSAPPRKLSRHLATVTMTSFLSMSTSTKTTGMS